MKEAKALTLIECRGTDYEIGQQYGEACRENIHRSIEMEYMFLQQISKEQIIAYVNEFLLLVKEFDPQAVDLIKGIAEGAGIVFEEALMLRATMELAFYSSHIPGLCTSFAATGDATKGGKTFLGQNVDFFEGTPVDLLRIKRSEGIEQLSLAFGGAMECGLNSAGIGICFNTTLPPRDTYRPGIPWGCYLPKALRQRTIGSALGVFCQAARGPLYHQLASAEGEIIGIESVFDDFNVIQPEKDMLVHSNHYLTERFKKGDWMYQAAPDTYLRLQRIKRLMEQNYGQLTPQLMTEFLADHHNYPRGICSHVDETRPRPRTLTLTSFIMVPEERAMYVAYGNPCQYEYIEYKL